MNAEIKSYCRNIVSNPMKIKDSVKKGYAGIALRQSSCCGPAAACGSSNFQETISKSVGYSDGDLKAVPEGANLGLGCGNPVALASLREGETVLDLGSGAGFDCFLAAERVGKKGKVIGVDMTPEMVEKARGNAEKGDYRNVEFRQGEIEHLPIDADSVDAVISNCVINLSPDKKSVFKEIYRVLKPGARLMVSDIVLTRELPGPVINSVEAYIGCLAGAVMKNDYLDSIKTAGFREVKVLAETSFPVEFLANDPIGKAIMEKSKMSFAELKELANSLVSIKVSGIKPDQSA